MYKCKVVKIENMVNALCYVQYIHLELWQHLPHEQYISFYVLRNLTCILLLQLFRDLLIFFCFHICYNLVTLTHCNILLFQYLFVFICFNIQIYTASFYLSPYMLIHPIYILCSPFSCYSVSRFSRFPEFSQQLAIKPF